MHILSLLQRIFRSKILMNMRYFMLIKACSYTNYSIKNKAENELKIRIYSAIHLQNGLYLLLKAKHNSLRSVHIFPSKALYIGPKYFWTWDLDHLTYQQPPVSQTVPSCRRILTSAPCRRLFENVTSNLSVCQNVFN